MTYNLIHNDTYAYFDGENYSLNHAPIFTKQDAVNIMIKDINDTYMSMVRVDDNQYRIMETSCGVVVVYFTIEFDDSAEPDEHGKYKPSVPFATIKDIRDHYDEEVGLECRNEAEKQFHGN